MMEKQEIKIFGLVDRTAFYIGFVICFIIQIGINCFVYFRGQKDGYNKAKEEMQAQIKLDKKTLNNHAKELKTIDSESTNDANNRLKENLRSN